MKGQENENRKGILKSLFELKAVHVHGVKLDVDVEEKLAEIQTKGIDVNELLRQFLKERSEKNRTEKRRNRQ